MPLLIRLSWEPRPASEQIAAYNIFIDGSKQSVAPGPPSDFVLDTPGPHAITISAVNSRGEGEHSEPFLIPPIPGRVTGVTGEIIE